MKRRKSNVKPVTNRASEVKESANGVFDKYLPRWISQFIYVTLWEPVSPASLALFRIIWGLIMLYESYTYMAKDWGKLRYILNLRYYFKYYGFDWVYLWSGNGMYYHIYLMMFCSLLIIFGFFYKFAAAAFFFLFAWLYLQEMTLYLNHFYLFLLVTYSIQFKLLVNEHFTVDASLRGKKKNTIEYWNVWVFQVLVAIVYTFAAVCKMNEDWLFRAEPLLHWLPRRNHLALIGPILAQPWAAYLFSWSGLALDLSAGISLLHPVTRPLITPFICMFHLLNKLIFNIGIFPWMMLASTTIFYSGDWPLRVLSFIYPKMKKQLQQKSSTSAPQRNLSGRQMLVLFCLTVFVLHQILVPLRQFTYPGNVNWTEEGHRWSWRMKLRDKNGEIYFFVHPKGGAEPEPFELKRVLTQKQIDKMSCRPELIHLFAHALADNYEKRHGYKPKVTAASICSLNYRRYQHMVKPDFDLASVPPWSWPNEWVVPLVPLGVNESEWFDLPHRVRLDDTIPHLGQTAQEVLNKDKDKNNQAEK